ncbi:MAG: hypothetical protein HS104_14325 [Polyangiaceae bacterium]|nr:hypothetical protein [Polyangiaceae bacterium]MCL4748913.1 hypothetical protein [Myxococcales bacterium]
MSTPNIARPPVLDQLAAERTTLTADPDRDGGLIPLGMVCSRAILDAESPDNPEGAALTAITRELRGIRAALELVACAGDSVSTADVDAIHDQIISLARRAEWMHEYASRLKSAQARVFPYADAETSKVPS